MMTLNRLAAQRALYKALFVASFLALTAPHTGDALTLEQALNQGAYGQASRDIAAAPSTSTALYQKGIVAAYMGDYSQAYDQLSSLSDSTGDVNRALSGLRLALAQAAQNRGQLDEAAKWLNAYANGSGSNLYPDFYQLISNRQSELTQGAAAGTRYSRELRVGLMVPLSGSLAGIGQNIMRAAQLATFQQPYENLRVFPIDSQSGLEAFNTLQSLQVDLVIGPLLAQTVNAIKDSANASHTPIIAFSSDRAVAGGEVRLISYSPAQQARMMARFAEQEGKIKLAALVPNTAYGKEALAAFKDEANKLGLNFMKEVFYDPSSKDLGTAMKSLAQLKPPATPQQKERNRLEAEYKKVGAAMDPASFKRLKELRRQRTDKAVTFEALFMPSAAESLPLITSQLVYNDIDSNSIYLLGTSQWDDPKALISKGEYMRNAFFPAPSRDAAEKFRTLYSQTYGAQPHPLAILGYDAISLAVSTLRDGTSFNLDTALSPQTSYFGASGAFRFGKDNLAEHSYDILQITSDGFTRYKPSPDAFLPQGFGLSSDYSHDSGGNAPGGRWFDRILPRD